MKQDYKVKRETQCQLVIKEYPIPSAHTTFQVVDE